MYLITPIARTRLTFTFADFAEKTATVLPMIVGGVLASSIFRIGVGADQSMGLEDANHTGLGLGALHSSTLPVVEGLHEYYEAFSEGFLVV